MLFQKDIEPRCAYCQRGAQLEDDKILCVRKGVVSPGGRGRPVQYHPRPPGAPPPGGPAISPRTVAGFYHLPCDRFPRRRCSPTSAS